MFVVNARDGETGQIRDWCFRFAEQGSKHANRLVQLPEVNPNHPEVVLGASEVGASPGHSEERRLSPERIIERPTGATDRVREGGRGVVEQSPRFERGAQRREILGGMASGEEQATCRSLRGVGVVGPGEHLVEHGHREGGGIQLGETVRQQLVYAGPQRVVGGQQTP